MLYSGINSALGDNVTLLLPQNASWSNFLYFPLQLDCILCAQVSKAYSKTWSYREDALLAVYKQMQELPVRDKEEAKTMMRAAIFLVKRGIDDKVYAVSHVVLWTSGENVVFVCVCVCVFCFGEGERGLSFLTLSAGTSSTWTDWTDCCCFMPHQLWWLSQRSTR